MRTALPVALAGPAAALLAAALLAACSGTPAPAAHRPAPPAATRSPHAAPPLPRGVTIAPQAARLPRGPFTIEPLHCGRFTAAQRDQYGTTARGGFAYAFADVSPTLTGAPSLTVDFLRGSRVVASNLTGDTSPIGPGQSALAEVDAVGASGQPVTFSSCQLMGYAAVTGSGIVPGSYAP